jgi:hypothetical protein
MSPLKARQIQFMRDLPKLINKAFELGYEVTAGELWRSQEQQKIYVETGRSKTMLSEHPNRCAVDLNLFINGVLCTLDQIEPLGEYWESLGDGHVWGGRFKTLKDSPHFELRD